jgi:gamma-glutamylcyclotransferase (GGCT)/AIG2-like uncharacterized protein YtfP
VPIHHYFAYGSNMNPARVRTRGLRVRGMLAGRVAGFDLAFDKQSREHAGTGHANLVFAPGQHAEGVLYELVSEAEIRRMDPFEHAPVNYSREAVAVQTAVGVIHAWTYFANPAACVRGARPEAAYLAHLLCGRPWLSEAWYARLAAWPTVERGR